MPDDPQADPNNTAWRAGYDAAPNARCPYEMGPKFGHWLAGVTARAEDDVAGRAPYWWDTSKQDRAA